MPAKGSVSLWVCTFVRPNCESMAERGELLEKLDGLRARFEEIGTLIADPAVIADRGR